MIENIHGAAHLGQVAEPGPDNDWGLKELDQALAEGIRLRLSG